ncbi:LLM class flavin-dependent oxidoreductase [Amycolatopsis suaedae]|uniref:LLM class flavin-dependent oxidoreductase n=1 Tax=Amycolatopsis suaedae TaxID=2510978 RepID=A0A4Q7J841_9PSEU|nr:LLM class flavin-dependent oxidoreductase [Amycolatopsis suaedae]RZQ62982.1 LLM class flavin-dependent oxidoreductase [Amycolatopsis suaedae]
MTSPNYAPMTLSVGTPLQARVPGDVIPFARLAEASRGQRMWFGNSGLLDSQSLIAYFVGKGIEISYASGVALTPLRHPYDAALTARSIAALSGRRYTAGFGPATPAFVRALRADAYRSPKAAAAEFATIVGRLCAADGVVTFHGEYFTQRDLPAFEPGPEVEVGLGVIRPSMARTTGSVADVAISWLTSPAYLTATLLPALREGAREAGRPVPRLATLVQVAVRRPGRDPAVLADSAAGLHLRGAHYRDMLRRSGLTLSGVDALDDARELVDRGIFLYGSPEEIADRLREYHACGVGELVVKTTGVQVTEGLRAAVDDLVAVFAAADQLRPGTASVRT